MEGVKNSTRKQDFYLSVINLLKETTNLTKIQKELNISKQNLNYYLRQLKNNGLVSNSASGLWELTEDGKNPSKYGKLLTKDISRGHAYIIEVKLPKEVEGWHNRIKVLEQKQINYKLVGAKLDTPRIKALGRKVWLCNTHLRIFDTPEASYYGLNAVQSRVIAFNEFKKIVSVLENKLGIRLNPTDIVWKKEHYALIKNDLAIEENRRGNIIRVSDENGEWLLVDDSLGKGGELETIGKKALVTNIPMQKWWNDMKDTKFAWTPSVIANQISQVTSNQQMFAQNLESHVKSIKELGNSAEANAKSVELLSQVILQLRDEVINLHGEISSLKK